MSGKITNGFGLWKMGALRERERERQKRSTSGKKK